MKSSFDYKISTVVEKQLEVDSIGECSIIAVDNVGKEYYLIIHTGYGMTQIIEYGPIIPDIEELPNYVSYTYKMIEYDEYKLEKIIDAFLNNSKRAIESAEVISFEQAKESIRNMVDFI